ncbi:amino acid permease-domain-containing protein [Russula vinacea]|nr:amino acid permease-domain-containing protein [Russula vinacea]
MTIYAKASPVGVKSRFIAVSTLTRGSGLSVNRQVIQWWPWVPDPDSTASFYHADLDKVQRKLSGVHVQMYVRSRCLEDVLSQSLYNQIAGVIGTGLFLGLGQLLTTTGPLGVLLVFLLVGSVAFASIVSVTEMAVFAPVTGSFSHYGALATVQSNAVDNPGVSAARWVDPALGFAVGWNYFYSNHVSIYIAVLIAAVYIVNMLGLRSFGHTEAFFATLKLMLVIGLIIGGLVINLGGGPDHTRHGFEYWKHPGPLVSSLEPGALGRFLGLILGIIYAAFAMCGMEIITLAAAETRNPRKNMINAMRTVFFRIFICYVLTGLIVGMLIPSNDPELFKKTGNAGQSPFVLVFNRAGVKSPGPDERLLIGERHVVLGLEIAVCTRCTRTGPEIYYDSLSQWLALRCYHDRRRLLVFAFLNANISSGKVFSWFVNLSAVGGLLNWLMIGITYLRFYYGLKAQGLERHGGYRSVFQPYAGMYVVFWSAIFIIVSGLSVFWSFNGPDFVAAYINLPVFALLYVSWKIFKGTKLCAFI